MTIAKFFRTCCLLVAAIRVGPAMAAEDWTPFTWIMHPQPGTTTDRSAILLPVQLDGKACSMQLDTGAGASVLYRPALPAGYAATGAQLAIAHFSLGTLTGPHAFGLLYDDDPAHREPGCRERDGNRLVGTLGNDVFADGTLALDLANTRFRFTRGAGSLPQDDGNSTPFDLMDLGHGYGQVPVIDAALADGRHVSLLFDTGSAPVELGVFHQADWLALVGAEGARDATRLSTVAWGKPLTCRIAPLLQAMRIGAVVLDKHARAIFCAGADGPLFENRREFGLVGIAPFHDKVITLDYVRRRLFVTAPASP